MTNNTSKSKNQGFGTKLIHAGEPVDPLTGAVAPVLVRSKTFRQPVFGEKAKWEYSRGKNPTRSILESKLAELAGAGQATVFGSGDAATTMFLLTLKPGDRIICCKELYGGTVRLFDQLFADFGIHVDYIDVEDVAAVRAVRTDRTVAIWVESPTNPKLGIIDLDKVGKIARELKLRFIVDLTFAPPCTTDPFAYGAETVVYSLSKYFAGHNDVIGGAIVTRNEALHERLCWLQGSVGAILSPDECYRTIQEVKTLELRWAHVSASAQAVAEYLSRHPRIKEVYYPGLPDHPGRDVAARQMRNGYSGTLAFDLQTSDLQQIGDLVDRLQATGLVVFGESLASPETLLAHPATMSHRGLTQRQRDERGIDNGFFRLSLGFEDPKDIINAFGEALAALEKHGA